MNNIFLFSILIVNILLFLFFSITQSFPQSAVLIHIVNILLLIGSLINFKHAFSIVKVHKIDMILVISLFLLAFALYIYKIGEITPGIQGDELTVAKTGEYVLSSSKIVPFVDINYGHATPLLYLEGISIAFFGRTLLAIRLTSIIFGALGVVMFYVLLRFFFHKTVSLFTSLMMLFCYPFVVVCRLAYEITPELFFQILSTILLYMAWKTRSKKYYIALGMSLGAGLYTYVGFRTFTLFIISILGVFIIRTSKDKKLLISIGTYFIIGFFILVTPLLSYSVGHTNQIMARTKSLSLFGQNLPPIEVVKELQGSTLRLSHLFFLVGDVNNKPNGDPNFKQNPSNINMFDFVTFILLLMGGGFLLKKNRNLFIIILILSLSPIINDIFSLERIPEGHYYGLGHPNTLRIAGIIPIIYFITAYGLESIKPYAKKIAGLYPSIITLASFIIIGINWYLYFKQPDNQWYSIYNYQENGVRTLHVADVINKSLFNKVYISPSFIADERLKYFTKNKVTIISYKPKSVEQILLNENSTNLVIFDPDFNPNLGKNFFETVKSNPDLFHGTLLTSPDNKIDAFILSKNIQ